MITYLVFLLKCVDLSLADAGIVVEGSSHGIKRSGVDWCFIKILLAKLAFFLCKSVLN
jgi:hypothetical protein